MTCWRDDLCLKPSVRFALLLVLKASKSYDLQSIQLRSSGFRVPGSGSGFRVPGSEFRFLGSGFR
eukprot:1542945-Karenia_brevis.AAC.1